MRAIHLLLIPAVLAFLSPAIKGSEEAPNKPAATRTAGMKTATWRVSIGFFGQENTPLDVEATLKNKRVSFPEGASARYDEATGMLTVHNTPEQLMAVEAAIFDYRRTIPIGQKKWTLSKDCIQKLSQGKKSLKKDTLECVRSLGYPVISAKLKGNELNVQAAMEELEKLSTTLEADNLGAVPGKTKRLGYLKARAYWHQTGKKNSFDESAPMPAPGPEDIVLDKEDSPQLYKQTWKVPKSFLAQLDEDDTACIWKADAQICLTMMTSIRFLNVEGASANFKNGKLTVIHRQERLDELQAFLTDSSCTQIGKTTPVSIEDAERLKPKKHKKKVKTSDGRVLDIEELYNEFEDNNQNEE